MDIVAGKQLSIQVLIRADVPTIIPGHTIGLILADIHISSIKKRNTSLDVAAGKQPSIQVLIRADVSLSRHSYPLIKKRNTSLDIVAGKQLSIQVLIRADVPAIIPGHTIGSILSRHLYLLDQEEKY